MNLKRPKIAIIDTNTLAVLGLKQLIQQVIPIVTVDTFGTLEEFIVNTTDDYVHYFAAMNIVLENRNFFLDHRAKTIVLTNEPAPDTSHFSKATGRRDSGNPHTSHLTDFHCLCINVPEQELVHSLLSLQQHAHGGGRNMPPMPAVLQKKILSDREIEVMALIVQGYINKEIADRLHISLSTVITHRKNIMDKLGFKSVSALTIYAVTHGYVDINTI